MKTIVRVILETEGETLAAFAEEVDIFSERFAPIQKCDDPFIAWAVNEHSIPEAERLYQIRRYSAKNLGDAITNQLMRVLAERDTLNGYPLA